MTSILIERINVLALDWLTSAEALAVLGTQPQTLYANVSRGRIRAKKDPDDPRRSLYSGEDVRRLADRSPGRRKAESVASDAIRWGEPILKTTLSTVEHGRLFYRGVDAVRLAETATLEDVAALLWQVGAVRLAGEASGDGEPLERAFVALGRRAARDLPSLGRGPQVLRREAQSVAATMISAMVGGSEGLVHERAAAAWGRPEAADVIRRAMVLLADHELNASAFAARVAISTGSALSAAALAGLGALTGPLHGGAWAGVVALMELVERDGAEAAVRNWLGQGRPLPTFGHRLYPDGDIRAAALMVAFELPPAFAALREAGERIVGERPNVDFAMAALTTAHGLPERAPILIFAMARCVGWLAHALEQIERGELIRPRAHYIGQKPGSQAV